MTEQPDPVRHRPKLESFRAAVQAGVEDADAGRTVPWEKIRPWVLSWGTEGETLPSET